MNHTTKSKNRWKKNHTQPNQAAALARPTSWKRLAGLGLCLLLAAGGTWAIMEYVVWDKLPPELVGKWVVTGGEQEGATFDFYRNGTMVARVNNRGNLDLVNAQVAVEGDTLFITTRHPVNHSEMTKKQTIKTLTGQQLVLQDEQSHVFRMERAGD
jgi:uncharacterized protein (TIGR03066 family)